MKYCLLPLLLSLPAAAETPYQGADDSGVSHAVDAPRPTRASDRPQAAVMPAGSSPMAAAPPLPITHYRVSFNSPRNGDVLCSQLGNISLSAALDPLPEHYQLELWLDGQAAARVSNSTSLTLENLAREQYQAFFKLLDKNGKFLAESSTITFYLHKARVGQASQAAP